MKPYLSFAIWMTLSSIVFKLLLLQLDVDYQSRVMYVAFFNLLVISVGTFFGIRKYKILNPNTSSFKEDFKAGMRIAAVYAILMAVFVFVYYNYIDVEYFKEMIRIRMENTAKFADQVSPEDLKNHENTVRMIFSAKTHSTVTLFGFLAAGGIYSALISFFMRKFPGFK